MSSIVPALDFPQKEQYNSLAERFSLLLPQNTATPLRSLHHSRRFWKNSPGFWVQLGGGARCGVGGGGGPPPRHAAPPQYDKKRGRKKRGASGRGVFPQRLNSRHSRSQGNRDRR